MGKHISFMELKHGEFHPSDEGLKLANSIKG